MKEILTKLDYNVYGRVKDIRTDEKFDVITLFHVFEYLSTLLKDLRGLYGLLKEGGEIIIEISQPSDFVETS